MASDKSTAPEKSRLQRLKDDSGDDRFMPSMPPIDCGGHLLEYLWEWGPTMAGSMGDSPLTHAEIRACQENTWVELTGWEASTLARLSKEYFGESHRAIKRDCPPPFGDSSGVAQLKQAELNRQLDAFLT